MRKTAILCFFACLLLLAPSGAASSQAGLRTGRAHGIVTDDDGKPVASARIELKYLKSYSSYVRKIEEHNEDEPAVRVKTGKDGRWSLHSLRPGVWDVFASADGYFPASAKCNAMQVGSSCFVLLKLERTPEKIKEEKRKKLPPGGNADDLLEPRERELLAENAMLEMADAKYLLKNYDEAVELYETYARSHPDAYLVGLSIAYCLREKGDLDAAIARFEAVVESTSKDPLDAYFTAEANAGIGDCHWRRKDAAKAKLYYGRAVELSDLNELWPFNLGEICYFLSETDEAILAYEKAARIAPAWSDPEYKLGIAYIQKSDWQKAAAHFERFLALEKSTPRSNSAGKMLAELKSKIPPRN